MNPQQALQLLDHLCKLMQMNWTDHLRAREAVKVLSELVVSMENIKPVKSELIKDPLPTDFLKELGKDD